MEKGQGLGDSAAGSYPFNYWRHRNVYSNLEEGLTEVARKVVSGSGSPLNEREVFDCFDH